MVGSTGRDIYTSLQHFNSLCNTKTRKKMVLSGKGRIQTAESAPPHHAGYSLLFHICCISKDIKISQRGVHPFNSAYTQLVVPSSSGSKVFFMCRCERCVQMKEYLPGYSVCRNTWKNPIMTTQVIHFYSQLGFLGHRAASSLFERPRFTMTSAGCKWSV